MKETICTIPINDLFQPKDGCPLCRMRAMLEEQYVDFVTGDAMMEPGIRIETNKKGFCRRHLIKMAQNGKRLPNALILESHLMEVMDVHTAKPPKGKPDKKQLEGLRQMLASCYVCGRIDSDMKHLMGTVFSEWEKSTDFRALYRAQPYLCLPHYEEIMTAATGKGGVSSKNLAAFYDDTLALTRTHLEALKEDVSYFVTMFDYRNRDKDWGTSVNAPERTIDYLTGEDTALS